MGRIVFFILVLFSGICSVNATPTIEVVNTLKDYKVFLYEFENAKGDEQKQLAAWENYEKKYEYLFSKDAFDLNRNNDKLEDLKKYFKKLPEIKNKVLELYPKANQVVLKSAESFSKVFKDFKDSNIVIKVYLISSSKKMNGYATTIEGNPVVLLGMDGTVMIGQNEKDVEFVFAHELHHIYWGRIKHGDDDKDSFDVALWFEGFATYASGLVTGFSDDVVLSDSWLAEKCKDPA